jgi:hypothetical protein
MMIEPSRRLSSLELSQKILEMGKTGVYRESIFEALHPYATKKQIRAAIAHAKQCGLHSVANLRDDTLGTYYQLDLVKYQTLKPTLQDTLPLMEQGELAQQLLSTTRTLHQVLAFTRMAWMALAIAACLSFLLGSNRLGFGTLSGAVSIAFLWGVQQQWVRRSPTVKDTQLNPLPPNDR